MDGHSGVLIADADEAARAALARILRTAGHHVIQADTGDEALALARSTTPAAVILEVPLLGLSGYEVCHALSPTPAGRCRSSSSPGSHGVLRPRRRPAARRRRLPHQALRRGRAARAADEPDPPLARAHPGRGPAPDQAGARGARAARRRPSARRRSPAGSSSARRPSRPTSSTSCASSTRAAARRRSPSPTARRSSRSAMPVMPSGGPGGERTAGARSHQRPQQLQVAAARA